MPDRDAQVNSRALDWERINAWRVTDEHGCAGGWLGIVPEVAEFDDSRVGRAAKHCAASLCVTFQHSDRVDFNVRLAILNGNVELAGSSAQDTEADASFWSDDLVGFYRWLNGGETSLRSQLQQSPRISGSLEALSTLAGAISALRPNPPSGCQVPPRVPRLVSVDFPLLGPWFEPLG
jgi:hypothetical protein